MRIETLAAVLEIAGAGGALAFAIRRQSITLAAVGLMFAFLAWKDCHLPRP